MSALEWVYFVFLMLMLLQGVLSIYFNLHAWSNPERHKEIRSPQVFERPFHSFTIMLPALHEEAVMNGTLKRMKELNYPNDLYEVMVILQPVDTTTYKVCEDAIKEHGIKNARILVVDGEHKPLNKPYQLNFALEQSQGDSIVIFDSEDEVHPDILNIANTLYLTKPVDVIQCGVQLMNYDSFWFSAHNVLEYFFWFKSRMHIHTGMNSVPLGGNTVFFKTDQVREVGGWNEHCLTEDAEIGIRLSIRGYEIYSTYDPIHVTKEETPESIEQFVKQRTRWCQGFIQVVKLGHWKQYPQLKQILMSLYIIGYPTVQAVLFILSPIMMVFGFVADFTIGLSILSFAPVILVGVLIMVQLLGLYEFVKEQKLKFKWHVFLLFIPTFLPYQLMLYAGALRAAWREFKGQNNWEKTAHSGTHRAPEPANISSSAKGSA